MILNLPSVLPIRQSDPCFLPTVSTQNQTELFHCRSTMLFSLRNLCKTSNYSNLKFRNEDMQRFCKKGVSFSENLRLLDEDLIELVQIRHTL